MISRRLASLHPVDPVTAASFIDEAPELRLQAEGGNARAASELLALVADRSMAKWPAFLTDPLSLTIWEAQVDQGLATLLRTPSSLLMSAGLARESLLTMPVRLEPSPYPAGGAWVPPSRIGDFAQLIDRRVETVARKLHDAEVDPFLSIGFMAVAVDYAQRHGLGLMEASGVVDPDRLQELLAANQVVLPSQRQLDPQLRTRIEKALKPPEKPGRLKRLFGRS